jgi:uncharacterized phage protein (TIGR02216 family)
MGFAFAVLRLSPGAFWTMTPRELSAAIDTISPRLRQRPGRGDLDRLMGRFPD